MSAFLLYTIMKQDKSFYLGDRSLAMSDGDWISDFGLNFRPCNETRLLVCGVCSGEGSDF
jgi:hypothetical protein